MLYTDECLIQPITKGSQFGENTEGTAFYSSCRVEREDHVRRGADGNYITYNCLIVLPSGTDIKETYTVQVTKERGVTVLDSVRKVAKVFPVGGFVPHHLEVYTK